MMMASRQLFLSPRSFPSFRLISLKCPHHEPPVVVQLSCCSISFFFYFYYFLFPLESLHQKLTCPSLWCCFLLSFSTLISVTFVTFFLAVLLTALAFICCKRYWKERDPQTEYDASLHESQFYRMACSNSNAPLVSFSPSFQSTAGTTLSNQPSIISSSTPANGLINPLLQSYPLRIESFSSHHQMAQHALNPIPGYRRLTNSSSSSSTTQTSSGMHPLTLAALLEPPPPYTSILALDREDESELSMRTHSDNSTQENNNNLNNNSSNNEETNTNNTVNNNNNNNRNLSATSPPVTIGPHRFSQRRLKTKPLWRKLSQ